MARRIVQKSKPKLNSRQKAWNVLTDAVIKASIREHHAKQLKQRPERTPSWWIGVSREEWPATARAQVDRMVVSKGAQWVSGNISPL